jgi:predicted lipase
MSATFKMINHQVLSVICADSYDNLDFEESGIEVIVREDSVFAFRGTDEPLDAIRDIRIIPLWTKDLGWCPAGFLKASKRLVTKVMSECMARDIEPEDITLTGHSLGGAVALIVGALLVRDEVKVKEIVTFGAPRCGRLKILDDTDVTMYRHGKDIVPMVPFIMRRHKKMETFGDKGSYIKDHYMFNYIAMEKTKRPSE